MWCSVLFFLIVVATTVHCQSPAGKDKECEWRENVTDIEELPQHKYEVLEDCLYYFLSKKADKDYGKTNSLVLLPPTSKPRETITVVLHKALIRQMWMNEVWKEMHVNGYMLLSWMDRRLEWSALEWKLDKLKINSYGHLWMPDIYSEKYQTSMQASDFTLYQDIKATSWGNVTSRLEYRMQAPCVVDYTNFPDDEKHCCFNLKSQLFANVLKFQVIDTKGDRDPDILQTTWDIQEITVTKEMEDEDKSEYIQFCLRANRKSSTLRIELTIPVVISAIVLLVAPLFGGFRSQLYVKLFALLLQFLCFQYLVEKTPQLGFGDSVPHLYRFYEFSVGATLTSLLITLLISAVARVERSLPPPHSCILAAAALNKRLCCSGDTDSSQDATHPESGSSYTKDWREICVALNNLLSLVLILVYIIGVICLCS